MGAHRRRPGSLWDEVTGSDAAEHDTSPSGHGTPVVSVFGALVRYRRIWVPGLNAAQPNQK